MKLKDIVGILLIGLTLAFIGGGFYAANSLKAVKFDPDTLCPTGGANGVTIILIDKTDPLSATEQTRLRTLIDRERIVLATHAKIVISVLEQDAGSRDVSAKTLLALCNPGSDANPLLENPKRIAARYVQSFAKPIDTALAHVVDRNSSPSSPIAQAVTAIIQEQGQTWSDTGQVPAHRKFVLVSDLMEHSVLASAYNGSLTAPLLARLISKETQGWLSLAQIEIILLSRNGSRDRQKAARTAWLDFFKLIKAPQPIIWPN